MSFVHFPQLHADPCRAFWRYAYREIRFVYSSVYTRVYKRTTPVSDKERNIRAAFSIVASEVARRKHKGDTRPRAVIWNEVKKEMEAGQVLGKCYASAGQLGNDGDI